MSERPAVRGAVVDEQTRCVHYRTPLDVVALEFACCEEFYPCHLCHAEAADHPARVWPRDRREREAVMCGVCGHRLRIAEYLEATRCPHCDAGFNPGCAAHAHLYFEV